MKNREKDVLKEQAVLELADDDLAQAAGGSGDAPPYRSETNIEASVAGRTVFQWEIKEEIF